MSEVFEQEMAIPVVKGHKDLLAYFKQYLEENLDEDLIPIRFVVSKTDDDYYHCDVGCLRSDWDFGDREITSIFDEKIRGNENNDQFNVALIVPTGVGAELGGHAGDATPLSQLFGTVCDNLITHPNVVNASDINEMPANTLYVEGSVLSRLLLGTVGLQKVRSNRVLSLVEDHEDYTYVDNTVNAINAGRACYGLDCEKIVVPSPPFEMEAFESASGRAIGHISGMNSAFAMMEKYEDEMDAVAIATIIRCAPEIHMQYFESDGSMVNPWGGVEAMLTHTLSHIYGIPTAHGPVSESDETQDLEVGVVDPRMSAEVISTSYIQCVLKGLHRSPKMVTADAELAKPHTMTAEDVSVLVIPEGCLGLPTLAALNQGIPVIAVRENMNRMQNPLEMLPWASGKYIVVESYLEAIGIIQAMKAGTSLASLRRPLLKAQVDYFMYNDDTKNARIIDYYGEEADKIENGVRDYKEEEFDYDVEFVDGFLFGEDERLEVSAEQTEEAINPSTPL